MCLISFTIIGVSGCILPHIHQAKIRVSASPSWYILPFHAMADKNTKEHTCTHKRSY